MRYFTQVAVTPRSTVRYSVLFRWAGSLTTSPERDSIDTSHLVRGSGIAASNVEQLPRYALPRSSSVFSRRKLAVLDLKEKAQMGETLVLGHRQQCIKPGKWNFRLVSFDSLYSRFGIVPGLKKKQVVTNQFASKRSNDDIYSSHLFVSTNVIITYFRRSTKSR